MTTLDRVKKCFMYQLNEEVEPETELKSLDMDSLDEVELLMEIEREFCYDISDEKVEEVKTVKDIVDYIDSL